MHAQGSRSATPLHAYLIGAKKNDKRSIPWNPDTEAAFERCKKQLAEATLLAHPAENARLILTTDASDVAIGATLEQINDTNIQPLGFFSTKLSPTETRYSAYDRELLAIYKAIKFFRYMIEGRTVTVRTDHKPLTYAFFQKATKASPRQLRQLDHISQFTTRIEHIKGQDNIAADTLSRVAAIDMPVIVTTEELAEEQKTDAELENILKTPSSIELKKLRLDNTETTVYCNTTGEAIRVYVPTTLRRRIYDTVHNLSHPGGRITRKLISRRFIWPSMNKDITQWVRSCISCQKAKIHRHNRRIPVHIDMPDSRFQHIHIDIIGPLELSKGNKYCLTMIGLPDGRKQRRFQMLRQTQSYMHSSTHGSLDMEPQR